VSIDVKAIDTTAVVDIPLHIESKSGKAFGCTDQNGHVTLRVAANDGDVLTLRYCDAERCGWSPSTAAAQRQRMVELSKTWYLPVADRAARPRVRVEPGKDEYTIDVTVKPTISARGVVIDADGKHPIASAVVRPRFPSWAIFGTNPNGEFVAGGLPQRTDNEVFIQRAPIVLSVPLTEIQTLNSVALGEIRMPPDMTDKVGQLQLIGRNMGTGRDVDDSVLSGGVTLVSSDGEAMFTL
jgi:hypothetical protein